jgi:hypothetical protein
MASRRTIEHKAVKGAGNPSAAGPGRNSVPGGSLDRERPKTCHDLIFIRPKGYSIALLICNLQIMEGKNKAK